MSFYVFHEWFWFAVVFFPVVVGMLFLIPSWRRFLIFLAPWAALPALGVALFVSVGSGARIPWLFLEAGFGLDVTAKVFLFFTALIWLIAGFYAEFDTQGVSHAGRGVSSNAARAQFFGFYLFAMAGNLGLILAQDAISFYALFALMSFASWGLVVHAETQAAREAGRVYLVLVVIGEAFVFLSWVMAAYVAGSLYLPDWPGRLAVSPARDLIFAAALVGFGIKAGAVPLHVWLPLAHPVAPVPASAILSGAMINAGLLGWLRLFPLGIWGSSSWGGILIGFGLAAAFVGVLVGLTQTKNKAVLAYSSISQMGVMTVLVGIGMLDPGAWSLAQAALMVYVTHHALAKAALFLSVGVSFAQNRSVILKVLGVAGILLPVLAMAGAPLTSGALAKDAMKYGIEVLSSHEGWVQMVPGLLNVAAVGTTLLMARFFWLMRSVLLGQPGPVVKVGLYASWVAMVVAVWGLPVIFSAQVLVAIPGAGGLAGWTWNRSWPLVVGSLMAGGVVISRWSLRWGIPPGDLLVIYRTGVIWFHGQILLALKTVTNFRAGDRWRREYGRLVKDFLMAKPVGQVFPGMDSWSLSGMVVLLIWMIFFLMLA